jgi:hypothetical protein
MREVEHGSRLALTLRGNEPGPATAVDASAAAPVHAPVETSAGDWQAAWIDLGGEG